MIYFCADDYGISAAGNNRIETCLEYGVLNKVSVIPNGEIEDFKNRLTSRGALLSLHINLIEGRPLSEPSELNLIVSEKGFFKYSFTGLLLLSLSPKRRELEKQLYKEIQSQIKFWKEAVGEDVPISIDGHQHTHMIPLVFKTLMRVIEDEGLSVSNIRIPAEPLLPYLFTPSLYLEYNPVGLIKQWLLILLGCLNRKNLNKSGIESTLFMGVTFSGKLTEKRIKKLLPGYLKLSKKYNKNIEIGFHPGYLEEGESLIDGGQETFGKFYFSPWRKIEYNTLLDFDEMKEGE